MLTILRQHHFVLLCIGASVFVFPAFATAQTTWHVDDDASLGGTGASWTAAYKHLQDALVNPALVAGDEIRVAGGLYHPDRAENGGVMPGDVNVSFVIPAGVLLRGGYAGWSDWQDPDIRSEAAYPTVLSGDLLEDDDPADLVWSAASRQDNSYHVVLCQDGIEPCTIAGLRVIGGNARGDVEASGTGAGIQARDVHMRVINCWITRNVARHHGPGMTAWGERTVELTNCVISHNIAGVSGGGMWFNDVAVTLTNCTVADNTAGSQGGAIRLDRHDAPAGVVIVNSIFWGNSNPATQFMGDPSRYTITYSNIETGWSGEGTVSCDPQFVDPANGDYSFAGGSTSCCIDAGDNTALPTDIADLDGDGDTSEPTPIDLAGRSRTLDDTLIPDTGFGAAPLVDMGAFEHGMDCNNNGIDDFQEISDCDGSAWCLDCNGNGQLDECDIGQELSLDCNTNGTPDECEIATSDICPDAFCVEGCAFDYNGNCIPDECEPGLNIQTVLVDNAGNPPDACQEEYYGRVDYPYEIGVFEITAEQYCAFLNAVGATDTHWLYNTQMYTHPFGCKIRQLGPGGSHIYIVDADGDGEEDLEWLNRPVNFVSWGDAARFANWMHNGKPAGVQDASTTEDGSYLLEGAQTNEELLAVARRSDATWVVPSEDEWYKAAYHKNDGVTGSYWGYPTTSDDTPGYVNNSGNLSGTGAPFVDGGEDPGNYATYEGDLGTQGIGSPFFRSQVGEWENSASPYGTCDQGGNVWEWNEAVIGLQRGIRGGGFDSHFDDPLHACHRNHHPPSAQTGSCGFRLVLLAEPGPSGACCLPGAPYCLVESEVFCDAAGGSYRGDDTVCDFADDCNANGIPDECEEDLSIRIAVQPAHVTVCAGDTVTFNVEAIGHGGDLHYAWNVCGEPQGEDASTLTVESVTLDDHGCEVACEVFDDCDSAATVPVTLSVEQVTITDDYSVAALCPTSPVFGGGLLGFTYDGPSDDYDCDGSHASRLFAGRLDTSLGKLWRVKPDCAVHQFGALLGRPESVLVDAFGDWPGACGEPNLLIVGGHTDSDGLDRIYSLNPVNGSICEEYADTTFNHIGQMGLDSTGRLYAGSVEGNCVNALEEGVVFPFYCVDAGSPRAVAVDDAGNVYITSANDGVLRIIAPDGQPIDESFATGLEGAISQAIAPMGTFRGNLFVACGDRVMEVDLITGEVMEFIGCISAHGIAFDFNGFMHVSIPDEDKILKIGPNLPGDVNGDTFVDMGDLPGFILAVLHADHAPLPIVAADLNGDGCVNGLDIQAMVGELLD